MGGAFKRIDEFFEDEDHPIRAWILRAIIGLGFIVGFIDGLYTGFVSAGIGGAITYGLLGIVLGVIAGFITAMLVEFTIRAIPFVCLILILMGIVWLIRALWDVGKP